MFYRTLSATATLLLLTLSSFTQIPENSPQTAAQVELRKSAVAFLRETSGEVTTLRSLENRISFAAEMAGLMWFSDERESKVMYQAVITDFKQLLIEYDSQINATNLPLTGNENEWAMMTGGDDGRSALMMKMRKAIGVRQQIAMTMAEHDPSLAYNFYYDTLSQISNPDFRKQMEERDRYFESQLLMRIAAKDPAKALEFGKRSIEKGVSWTHADILRKLWDIDDEKGAEFAAEIVKKLKSDRISSDNLSNVSNFIGMGSNNSELVKAKGGKKRMFTDDQLRDLANLMADTILTRKSEFSPYELVNYIRWIEKYAPARMSQINAKFPKLKKESSEDIVALKAPPLRRDELPVDTKLTKEAEAIAAKQNEKAEMMKNVEKLANKELPKEERQKIVDQARKIIGGLGNRQEKIVSLGALAAQVAKLGDKELAAEIMKDAQSLVTISPKNYRDFIEVWMLVGGLSEADPEKAFPLLDDTIMRLNETIGAFVKIAEFIDISGEIIDDGEFQVGSFGGSMISGLTRDLGVANNTLKSLAVADFEKTKTLTNRFERTEVRILAKMLVLRSVLGDSAIKADGLVEKAIMSDEQ